MKPFVALLCILIFLLAVIGVAQIYDPLAGLTGVAHPEFKGMKVSTDNTDLHAHTKWLGYLFAMGLIAMFTTILVIGSKKSQQTTGMFKWLVLFGVLYAAIFSMMIFSNWAYVQDANHTFILEMPRPTAWMIYLVWLSPVMVTALYVLNFNKWVISPKEESELHAYLDNLKS